MNVMLWTVEQILKDSECCGNCFGCWKQFAQCSYFAVEEDVVG